MLKVTMNGFSARVQTGTSTQTYVLKFTTVPVTLNTLPLKLKNNTRHLRQHSGIVVAEHQTQNQEVPSSIYTQA